MVKKLEKCGVKIINSNDVFCESGVCRAVREGNPLYWDTNHLSEFGRKMLLTSIKDSNNAK
ncbi:SGNH hydrolase domain-containing protein [Vibrio jasicida]|uniref:SGNH hydrolase domain-containing protein n=1 Tax=Vibrio jasicida TaxID=766224 RepID=UPI004068FA9C